MLYPRSRCPTVWVQATKSRTLNWKSAHQQSKFAGFFKGGGYIQKRDKLARTHDSAKTSIEKNIIEMPETLSTLVMKEGTMDYRPGNGHEFKLVSRPANPKYESFFNSGKSMNKLNKSISSKLQKR